MNRGAISNNSAGNNGGGVYVYKGWFVKTSGTIDGTNRADRGRAVYSESGKVRNSPAGPEVTMDSRVSGRAGGWE